VDSLVVRATRRDPDLRPADAGEFLAEVTAVRATLPAVDSSPTLVVPRPATASPPPKVDPLRPRRPRRTGLLVAIAVGVLAVLALLGGWYLGSGRYTHAPPVVGFTPVAAQQKLHAAGLSSKVDPARVFSDDVKAGDVAQQRPKPNGRVRRHGTVTLVLSKGPDLRIVPKVIGSTVATAELALNDVGLRKGTETRRFSNAPKDLVIATDPPVGKALRPGAVVNLVVSLGPEQLPVPDVQNKKQDDAVRIVRAAGFQANVVLAFNDTVPSGVVADQSPSQGLASRNSTITLQVSKGPELIVVPDVTGEDVDTASAQLTAQGLQPQVIRPFGVGSTVHAQSPGGGSKVRKGSAVRLLVY
jgi:serine/threonine-protein kinase